MDNKVKVIALEIAKDYDDFVLSCLTSFGITKENMFDFKDRIFVEENRCVSIIGRRFFLDGRYIFDIIIADDGLEITEGSFKKTVRLTQFIDRGINKQYNERVEK